MREKATKLNKGHKKIHIESLKYLILIMKMNCIYIERVFKKKNLRIKTQRFNFRLEFQVLGNSRLKYLSEELPFKRAFTYNVFVINYIRFESIKFSTQHRWRKCVFYACNDNWRISSVRINIGKPPL